MKEARMLRQTVLFEGTDASGHAGLWETNGTADGTYELTGVPNGIFNPADFTIFNNEVLFQGQDTSLLYGIWETNETAAGTTEIGGFGSTGTHGASASGLLQSPNTFEPGAASRAGSRWVALTWPIPCPSRWVRPH